MSDRQPTAEELAEVQVFVTACFDEPSDKARTGEAFALQLIMQRNDLAALLREAANVLYCACGYTEIKDRKVCRCYGCSVLARINAALGEPNE